MTGLSTLQSKLDLLEPSKLENISRRIKAINEEMDLLKQTRESLAKNPLPSQHEKIEALWNIMSRWDEACLSVPLLVSRLQSLRRLHEESVDATSRLQHLEGRQTALAELLEQDRAALAKVGDSLSKNVVLLENNVRILQARAAEINEKINRLGLQEKTKS